MNPLGGGPRSRDFLTNATSGARTKCYPKAVLFHEFRDVPRNSNDNDPVFRPGGTHHDQFPVYQFAPTDIAHFEQLVGSDQLG